MTTRCGLARSGSRLYGWAGYPPMTSAGLAPGASQTFGSGHGCTFGPHHAVVDPMNQVKESNENNNTADIDVLC